MVNPAHTAPGRIRIIAGRWLGRRLPVIASEMLRPTPDRVRETLFNWIGPAVRGTRCLDLFAGTGILGLEALSRGAAQVVWIEADIRLVRALRQIQATLQAGGEVVCGDVTDWLTGFDPARSAPFDLVFLDPPFRRGLLEQVVQQLEQRALLSPQALIYLEHEREHQPALPPNWLPLRATHAGQVTAQLLRRQPVAQSD